MESCDYCGAEFDDEGALLSHMGEEHRDELGAIDERRVADHVDDGRELPTGPLILGGVVVFALLLTAYVILGLSGGGGVEVNGIQVSQSPGEVRSAHEHGTMNVTIDGERVDFSQPRYQPPDGEFFGSKFHFEGGNGEVWHAHATGVTLEYAMATLNIGVSEDSVTYQGTTYTDGENAAVEVTVNGESVDPASYELDGVAGNAGQGGDRVRIVVRTDGQ